MYWKTDPCPDCGCEAGEPCDNSERMHPKFDTSSPVCPACGGLTNVYEATVTEEKLAGAWGGNTFYSNERSYIDSYRLYVFVACREDKCTWEQTLKDKQVEF